MGRFEKQMEKDLKDLKVHEEHYFGKDSHVGNSLHKIYKNFEKNENKLLDSLNGLEEHEKMESLWKNLTKIHFFTLKLTQQTRISWKLLKHVRIFALNSQYSSLKKISLEKCTSSVMSLLRSSRRTKLTIFVTLSYVLSRQEREFTKSGTL